MKSTLLRLLCALMVTALAVTSVYMDIGAQRAAAEDAKIYAEKVERDQLRAVAAKEQAEAAKKEQEQLLQRQLTDETNQKKTYDLKPAGDGMNLFVNKVDGYSLEVPDNLNADMRFSDVRAVLESDDLKIEIYRQEITGADGVTAESYMQYSNQFIENNADHMKQAEGRIRISGKEAYYMQWSRSALKRISNDRNYYASVDIRVKAGEVVTLFFKSSRPLERESCLNVARSLKWFTPTEEPYCQKLYQVKNPHWDSATAAKYEQYFGDHKGLDWGIYETDAPINFTELKKIEDRMDFRFPILLYYTAVLEYDTMHPNLKAALENAQKEGRLLELTLQTVEQTPGKGNMVYDILDGKYDTYLKNYAKAVVDSDAPVLFRLGNEMNGDWCVYSSHHTSKDTDIFQAFYRYVYQIFEDAGADNVMWIWNPNGKAFPDFQWNNELCYYPGDDYVDVVGLTSYNTGTYYEGESWNEFDEMYAPMYEHYSSRYEKPLMITEFSCSSVGGSKEAWVENMFRDIKKFDRIKVAVWWDGCDWDADGNIARSYFIDETEELVNIFRKNLAEYKHQ